MKKLQKTWEEIMKVVFFLCGMVAIVMVVLIAGYVTIAGLPAIIEIGPIEFLFGTVWNSTAK